MLQKFFTFSVFFLSGAALLFSEEPPLRPTSLPLSSVGKSPYVVRVGLAHDKTQISVAAVNTFRLKGPDGSVLKSGVGGFEARVLAMPTGIQVGSETFSIDSLDVEVERGSVQIGKKSYRGMVRIFKKNGLHLTAVNHIDLETYLKGVLPLEVSASWPIEALKAHAVASRTFALFKSVEKRNEDFDLFDSVKAQVYGGSSFHKEETDRAVDETRSEVLICQGGLFPAFFHANSGGQTTTVESVWKNLAPHPALQSVQDPYSLGVKHDRWVLELPLLSIERVMHKQGYPAQNLKNISFLGQDESGRIQTVVLEYRLSTLKLSAPDFREFLGYNHFKSLKVAIQVKNGTAIFKGFGWGHGIGLSQWGAKAMAESGKTFQEILQFYFPGSELRIIS